jgi:FtsP/CotA-like multicopper oxidase with cupredoxin domain
VLIHPANDGEMHHSMHLDGFHLLIVGVDGFPLSPANRYMADTLVVAPGSRYDISVKAHQPGAWALHCRILSHRRGAEGTFGMVTALVVDRSVARDPLCPPEREPVSSGAWPRRT